MTKPSSSATTASHANDAADQTDIFSLIERHQDVTRAATAMQAMSHVLRFKILCLLSSGELSVQDIVEAVGTTQSNVSQHLGLLKNNGLTEWRRDGTKVFYRIADERIVEMIRLARDIFCSR